MKEDKVFSSEEAKAAFDEFHKVMKEEESPACIVIMARKGSTDAGSGLHVHGAVKGSPEILERILKEVLTESDKFYRVARNVIMDMTAERVGNILEAIEKVEPKSAPIAWAKGGKA